MEPNGQCWVRMLVGLLVIYIKACLKCCGLGRLTIASGREFQSEFRSDAMLKLMRLFISSRNCSFNLIRPISQWTTFTIMCHDNI